MEVPEILKKLEFNEGYFPREALQQAIARREQIIPDLLRIVEHARQNMEDLIEQDNYMAHLYAMFLLAQFRERRAYPLIVDFFSVPGEISLDITGDFVTENLDQVLASVCGGDTSAINGLTENESVNEYVRSAALRALLVLVACGEKSREEIVTYYQRLFRGKLKRVYSNVWNALVSCGSDLYPDELLGDIKQAFKDDLVDDSYIDLEWVQETLARGKEAVLTELREDRKCQLIQDTISEMEDWYCFRPDDESLWEEHESEGTPTPDMEGATFIPDEYQTVSGVTKIGRNDPCPCGSGKKYKKCCGAA